MNGKDLSEEVKNALKYTVLCNYSIKTLCGAVLQCRQFLFGKPNSSTGNKCSIAQRTIHHSLRGRIDQSSTCKTCSAYAELPANYNLCEHLIKDHQYSHALTLKAFLKQFSPDQLTDKVTWKKEHQNSTSNKLPQILPEQGRIHQTMVSSCTKHFSTFQLKQKLTENFYLHKNSHAC